MSLKSQTEHDSSASHVYFERFAFLEDVIWNLVTFRNVLHGKPKWPKTGHFAADSCFLSYIPLITIILKSVTFFVNFMICFRFVTVTVPAGRHIFALPCRSDLAGQRFSRFVVPLCWQLLVDRLLIRTVSSLCDIIKTKVHSSLVSHLVYQNFLQD